MIDRHCETPTSKRMRPEAKVLEVIDRGEPLWEFSPLLPKWTGLTKMVWAEVSPQEQPHGPTLKIGTSAEKPCGNYWLSMTVSNDPQVVSLIPDGISQKDLDLARKWIILNQNALLEHWHGRS